MNIDLGSELLTLLREVMDDDPIVLTLSNGKSNRVAAVEPEGVLISTTRSDAMDRPPQLVPAWMIERAWSHLTTHGELDNRYLLSSDGLNVKRSSAVCALLARLPGVSVTSSRPIRLAYRRPSS